MKMPPTKFDTITMNGGWNQTAPILSLPNGVVRDALNFECAVTGGYTRVQGYERFDGKFAPSNAAAHVIYIDSFVNIPAIGDIITGQVTGATGEVIAIGADYIAITKSVLSFNSSEQVKFGALIVGNSIPPTSPLTSKNAAIYKAAAADVYRANIGAVPGSGGLLGGFLYNDIVYVFRANTAATAADMYKSSASGWVNVPFYDEVYFTAGGIGVPADGDTLTEGGVTSTIKRVVLQSGSWAAGDATGKFIISAIAGGNYSAGAATAGAVAVTLSGIETAISLSASGKIEYKIGNFSGGTGTNRVYACNGADRAFEFDGTTLVPIDTGTLPDTPKHLAIHKNFLFLSIDTSLISSAPGLPYNFTALSGAGELATGYPITGLEVMPGNQSTATMMVTSRSVDGVHLLYGTAWSNFNYVPYVGAGGGALDYTIQNMAQTYMLDDRGVIGLQTTLNFGNFDASALSFNVNTFINANKNNASCSTVDRLKSQYRLFFSNGSALYFTVINGKLSGIMPIQFPDNPYQVFEGRFNNGTQGTFMCTNSGYLMHMEKGTSFDGADINAFVTLNYNSQSSHMVLKRYRKCSLEVFGLSYANISFGYSLGYGTSRISQPASKTYASDAGAAVQWDAFVWDSFVWDGVDITPFNIQMDGTGENVALTFKSGTNYYEPFTLNTATLNYTPRRALR